MKKRLYLLLAICCLSLLSFTACTTNDGIGNDNTTETTVARPTTGATTGTTTGTTIAPTTTTTTTTPTTR